MIPAIMVPKQEINLLCIAIVVFTIALYVLFHYQDKGDRS